MKKKILIIRFSSIGDIVLTTPVIRCLKQQLDADVYFITKKAFRPVLEANPYLTKIFTIEKKVSEVLPQLKEVGFDFIIDLHKNIRSFQIKKGVGVKSSSFAKLNIEKWLMTNFKIDQLPDVHIVDRYFATVRELGVEKDGKGLDYFIPNTEIMSMEVIEEMSGIPITGQPFIAFAIGGAHATKRMPAEKMIELCRVH